MYVDEPGYAEYCDALAPGPTVWPREVIAANAGAMGVAPESARWE
jgi:hypothetical protein